MSIKKIAIFGALMTASLSVFANPSDITGKWRSIDDKTGFSKGIVEITKNSQNIYTGKIVEIIPRPDYTPKSVCDKCSGSLKNAPIVGLTVLSNMKRSESNPNEFEGGTILDPLNGKEYKSKIKLNASGTRINLRGYIGVEIVGRSQTWIREP